MGVRNFGTLTTGCVSVLCRGNDAGTNRPFTFNNPAAKVRKFSARQVRAQQDAKKITTSPENVLRLFSVHMRWRGGVMVRPWSSFARTPP